MPTDSPTRQAPPDGQASPPEPAPRPSRLPPELSPRPGRLPRDLSPRPSRLPPELSPRGRPPSGGRPVRQRASRQPPRPEPYPQPGAARLPPVAGGRNRWLRQVAAIGLVLVGVAAAIAGVVWTLDTIDAPAPRYSHLPLTVVGGPPAHQVRRRAPQHAKAAAGTGHGGTAAAPLVVSGIRVFDPVGQEAQYYPHLTLAPSGQLQPPYVSETYRSAAFGGLKPGVGLLIDLGSTQPVGSLRVTISAGAAVQLRAANVPAASAAGYRTVAGSPSTSPVTTLTVNPVVRDRYWLLWITRLPAVSNGYQVTVSRITLR
jgi:hypothetical protein